MRGSTPEDLNISEKKANEVKKSKTTKENRPVGEAFDSGVNKLRNKFHDLFAKWRHNSDKLLRGFMKKYENRRVSRNKNIGGQVYEIVHK